MNTNKVYIGSISKIIKEERFGFVINQQCISIGDRLLYVKHGIFRLNIYDLITKEKYKIYPIDEVNIGDVFIYINNNILKPFDEICDEFNHHQSEKEIVERYKVYMKERNKLLCEKEEI